MPEHVLHVISHTHWDREWYLTFEQFRMKLVDLIDHLLDILDRDPDFRYFSLDGQMIILEDYLQIRPDRRADIERYVREGRLTIGPWYQLNDEFLVSGESTIRSMFTGHRMAGGFGPVMKVGYLPDQFGNISQMPQILNGFGIDNAIFGRGLQIAGDRKMEFHWQSPDGSRVLASLMAYWYNNAQHLPPDTGAAVDYLCAIRDRMKGISHVEHLLLMNGVDHLEAQPDVGGIIRRADEALDDVDVLHSTLPAYIDAVKASLAGRESELETVTGELREDRWSSVLAGTLSSRMYIKQANERCQTALEKYAEPACSMAYLLGDQYPSDYLTYAWKLLMQNHPHDSICGCSIDQVHREMMPRFDRVEQVAGELTERALRAVAGRVAVDGSSLVVFNPLNWTRTDRVRAVISFEIGDRSRELPEMDPSRDVESIRLLDAHGNDVPCAIVSAAVVAEQVLDPHDLPLAVMVKRFEVELLAEDVPACGYKTYSIEQCSKSTTAHSAGLNEIYWDSSLANEFLRLSLSGGVLSLERTDACDEGCCEVYSNINTFEDGGDVGDEYVYTAPGKDVLVTSLGSQPAVSIIDYSPVSVTMKLDLRLDLPECAESRGTGRSSATVSCPITTWLTITRSVPRLDVRTVVHNNARDHRLRVLFPNGLDTDTSCAEGQFDVLERPLAPPEDWPGASPFFPQQRWVDVSDGGRGMCVINKGMPEYEVYRDDSRSVAITLLRCVGRLSGGAEAPGASLTPEAQCQGEREFEYAIYPHSGDWEAGRVWMQAHQHNVPMRAVQTPAQDGDLPREMSFVETGSPDLVVSAIKKAEDSDMLVVRLYNTTTRDLPRSSVRVRGAKLARLLDLNERPVGEVVFSDETAVFDVPAKAIRTIGFTL